MSCVGRQCAWTGIDVVDGAGLGAVVVPGFGGADLTMTPLRRWLTDRGFAPTGAGLGFTLGCTGELVEKLEARVAAHAAATGGPVLVLGHSRGGWLGRLVAVRRPDLVRGLVMAGSPVLDPLDANPTALLVCRMLTRLAGLGVPGLLDDGCLAGDCREATAAGLTAPLAVPAIAFYTKADGVVGWRSCLDPAAEQVELHCSHNALCTDPAMFAALGPRLAGWVHGSRCI